jgi:hypothetical protein
MVFSGQSGLSRCGKMEKLPSFFFSAMFSW